MTSTPLYQEPAAWTPWKIIAIAVTLIAPFFIYFDTARSIVSIWNSSETFAHGYIILPVSLWLIWQRRGNLSRMTPAPYWPGLLLLAACGFGWLLADLADVQVVRQYAFVALLPLSVIVLVGWHVARSLAFPLLFLMAAVPFGDIFIEPLINFTADFTVAALQLTGIPVLREGNHFAIPSGNWSVVEACSGLRYLISSVTLGLLYAYLTYRSRVRQILFVLISIGVAILGNCLRAYMIVMIGHWSGMKLAVGVDHLIYGWVFFGLIMFLLFWIGSFWREDHHEPHPLTVEKTVATTPLPAPTTRQILFAAFSCLLCMSAWPLYAQYIQKSNVNAAPITLTNFESRLTEIAPFTSWLPHFSQASSELHRYYQNGANQVGLFLLYYRNQKPGAALISSSNQLVTRKDPIWHSIDSTIRTEQLVGRTLRIRETRLQSSTGALLVWHWYWIDNRFTSNDYVGKLFRAKEELLMRGDDGAGVMVFARYNDSADEARAVLHGFLEAHLPALETTLAGNAKQ